MASDVREYLRAAQAAEIRGDKARAVQLLRTAADEYQRAGNDPRAQQMLRHVERLQASGLEQGAALRQPERPQLVEPSRSQADIAVRQLKQAHLPEAGRLEAEVVLKSGELAARLAPELRIATSRLADAAAGERRSGAADPEFAERGPALADPAAPAWCSFCCRPRQEVGALVAGPAGAFICAACATHSSALLGGARTLTPGVSLPSEALAVGAPSQPQREAISALRTAVKERARLALLVGPEGSGKTLCLRALEEEGLGQYAEAIDGASIGRGALLLDGAERLSMEALRQLALALGANPFPCVLAARGTRPSAMQLRDSDRRFALHGTQELARATGGKIPHELLRLVRTAASLPAPTVQDLSRMAKRLLEHRGLGASSELAARIAAEASRSGDGGHEVRALVDRVPAGTWKPAGRTPRPRRAAKHRKGRR